MPNDDEKILEEAKSRFKLSEEAESEMRSLFLEDLRFRAGDQWSFASELIGWAQRVLFKMGKPHPLA